MNRPPDNPPPPQQPRLGRTKHRRTGKIARLPQSLRSQLNSLLDDGVPYLKIIETLGPDTRHLTPNNISDWKDGGYQDYLNEKSWREDMLARQETFTKLLTGCDPIKLPEAGLQLAATGACELLRDLCELTPGPDGKLDPDRFVRVSNSLSRVSRSILSLQQYRDAVAKAAALQLKRLDTTRDFRDTERTALLDRADALFGFKSAHRLQTETTPAPTSSFDVQGSTFKVQGSSPPVPAPQPTPSLSDSSYPSDPSDFPPIEIQNSELEDSAPPSEGRTAPPASSSFDVQGSTFNVQSSSPPSPSFPPLPSCEPPSAIENQNSKFNNPEEHCYDCGVLLPPLRPDGQRPFPDCRACNARLYPPGTQFYLCQFCNAAHPILPEHLPDTNCRRCSAPLPPPGQRYVTNCPSCGLKLPTITNLGTRLTDRCSGCRASLPLLEPAPAPEPVATAP